MQADEIRSELARLLAASAGTSTVERLAVLPQVPAGTAGAPANPALESASAVGTSALARELADLTKQVAGLREDAARQTANLESAASHQSGGSAGSTIERVAGVARSARNPLSLAISPLITGIAKLFGGGQAEPPPALPAFELPSSVSVDAGFSESRGDFGEVTRGVEAAPRIARSAATPLVSINVNAMDSRSFLDHSSEIARAVREAMLNSHSLNDVVNDL